MLSYAHKMLMKSITSVWILSIIKLYSKTQNISLFCF